MIRPEAIAIAGVDETENFLASQATDLFRSAFNKNSFN